MVLILSLLSCFFCIRWSQRKQKLYPPGPTPIPFIGNFHQMPIDTQPETFTKWAHTYGEIVYVHLFNKTFVFLNSLRATQDLMVKKGTIYSDRPRFVMWDDVYNLKPVTTSLKMNGDWREHRRWMQSALETDKALLGLHPLIRSSVDKLLVKLLNSPDAFFTHVRRYSSDLTLDIAYGMDNLTNDDHFNSTAQKAADAIVHGATVAALVEFLPILTYIPAWMPGTIYNQDVVKGRHNVRQLLDVPFSLLVKKIISGTYRPSFASALIEAKSENGQLSSWAESHIKGASATLYAGSAAVLLTLILTMVLHPDVLEKVHNEITSVIGSDRLPEFGDRKLLPYVEHVLMEVLRWNPPVPLGVPHCLAQDDIYNGYFLPKGASVISNIWAISRDPSIYPDPDAFRPERFEEMDAETLEMYDPRKYVFGFGRRICTGRYVADLSIWLAAVNILATMDIKKARDTFGAEIEPEFSFVTALTRYV
ncbi:hypothetical protein IEO21_09064 [Rhodonia placenta]|uniref:Cytochrome P450 n=1 Tax=Rhodonia placenta TaxID=104341 RepID=A0A8H7TY79_9APHY|nr:hypothetical protein IEO21_09064 [Postia placenta]